MPQTGQPAGHDTIVAVAQQADNRTPPDGLHGLLFKEEAAPDTVLNLGAAAGAGNVDVRMLIELPAVSMEGTEYAWLNTGFYAGTPDFSVRQNYPRLSSFMPSARS